MAKMKLPKGHGGFSIAGASYRPDKNGEVDVDTQHVAGAQEHGAKIIGDSDDADDEIDYSKKKIDELRAEFTKRFGIEPGDAGKASIISALEEGWNVFGLGELRGIYKKKFDVEAPKELKKEDLIEALSASSED